MSRLFLHYEGESPFTLKFVLGQPDVATVGDAVEVSIQ